MNHIFSRFLLSITFLLITTGVLYFDTSIKGQEVHYMNAVCDAKLTYREYECPYGTCLGKFIEYTNKEYNLHALSNYPIPNKYIAINKPINCLIQNNTYPWKLHIEGNLKLFTKDDIKTLTILILSVFLLFWNIYDLPNF